MRIYWHFYKTILFINIFLSIALVLLLGNISFYASMFATVGYLVSVGIVRFFENSTMYLYYNLGYSRFRLQLVAFLLNLSVAIIIYYLVHYLFDEQTFMY